MDEVGRTSAVIKRAGLWVSVILGILLVLIGVVVTVRANKSIGRWEQTLTEKEVLLSEIHHRVKNNMAVVSGLLELESMQNQDPKQALQDSRNRIQSMAMIHETLYQSESFSDINLSQYLQKLTKYIGETYIHDKKNINTQMHLDDVRLNINQAVPVGLIVNELLVNAITHKSNGIGSGQIILFLSELDGKVSLSIKNEGEVLSSDFSYKSADSSGLMIVKTLVRQLDADITFKEGNNTTFNLQFQKSDAAGSSNASL
jgi:two-component sensor histidine kinase